jgi:hypothetical protein
VEHALGGAAILARVVQNSCASRWWTSRTAIEDVARRRQRHHARQPRAVEHEAAPPAGAPRPRTDVFEVRVDEVLDAAVGRQCRPPSNWSFSNAQQRAGDFEEVRVGQTR